MTVKKLKINGPTCRLSKSICNLLINLTSWLFTEVEALKYLNYTNCFSPDISQKIML